VKERYTRLAPIDFSPKVESSTRLVHYTFSDESVGRDGFIVKWDAWQVENFQLNPVFLWSHLDEEPPIGKVIGLDVARQLRGAVKYAETEFADSIFELVKGGFLNAVSTSWKPIEAERSTKPGVDMVFTKVDLLEISQVCIGALPTALIDARSFGLNTRPLAQWAERALDTRNYRAVPRPQLEAIYRAASPAQSPTRSSSPTRVERVARVRELQRELVERDKRAEKVARLQAGLPLKRKEGEDVSSENIREAHGHMQRALRHCRSLAEHHDTLSEEAGNLSKIHRAITHTLAVLGVEDDKDLGRAMKDLNRCSRAISKAHGDADDAGDSVAFSVDHAADCLTAIGAAK
jgi:hypothetical protein